MCRRVTCSKCGRPTYAGCGAHIEQVLADVAVSDRCHCREAKAARPAEPGREAPSQARAWLHSLLGK